MLRKFASCILFSILLASILLALKTNPVRSQSMITVPDDFPTIQEAINNANEGDTVFVKSGTYYGSITLDKSAILLIGENSLSTIVDGGISVVSNNVSITGFTIRNVGVSLGDYANAVNNSKIFGNSIINAGISLLGPQTRDPVARANNHVFQNNITYGGIFLGMGCDLNTISENHIASNYIGIDIESNYNTISGNCIVENTIGIHFAHNEMSGVWDNRIVENYISNNQYGLYGESGMLSSTGFSENGFLVLEEPSYSDEIYHNNFVLNTFHVHAYPYYVWDNGCEGNYWSDYNGIDSDGDGIGDTFYIIDDSNQDNYPLMSPYMLGDINHDSIIDIFDCARMALAFSSTSINPNWNPHCDMNEDNVIDIFDLVAVAVNFGKEWTPP